MKQISFILVILLLIGCSSGSNKDIPMGKVTRGIFFIDINEEGEVKAINSENIISPSISWRYGSLKITQIIPDGREVKQGDTVLVFDPTEVRKAIVESESRLEINKAELERLKAQQESEIFELEADLEVAELSLEISKIKFESSEYEAKIKKKEFELNLEQANIALDRAKKQIENKKKIQAEEVRQKMLAISQAQAELDDSYSTLQKLLVTTPQPGIAIIRTNWTTNSKYQVGDQSWSGSPIIELPDLSELKAEVNINEVDIAKIKTGLKVQIRPDAFSDSIYSGEVISVANLAINKNNNSSVKVFPVSIKINNSNKVLMPGLTVNCRILINEIPNVNYVPVESVFHDGAIDYVYLKKGGTYKKTEVVTSQSNNDYIVIEKGLEEGDEVTLINPFADEMKKTESSNAL